MYGFTLDPLIGEFVLSHPDIKIPEKGESRSVCADAGAPSRVCAAAVHVSACLGMRLLH